jgi:hypothetical protein
MKTSVVGLGYSRTQGYFEATEGLKGMRLKIPVDAKRGTLALVYFTRIFKGPPVTTHILSGNVQWRCEFKGTEFWFDVYHMWLKARNAADVEQALHELEILPKIQKVFKREMVEWQTLCDYMPRSRPDIAIVQAALFNQNPVEVLRGDAKVNRAKIEKFLDYISPVIDNLL